MVSIPFQGQCAMKPQWSPWCIALMHSAESILHQDLFPSKVGTIACKIFFKECIHVLCLN